jgi:hypothetical protein
MSCNGEWQRLEQTTVASRKQRGQAKATGVRRCRTTVGGGGWGRAMTVDGDGAATQRWVGGGRLTNARWRRGPNAKWRHGPNAKG